MQTGFPETHVGCSRGRICVTNWFAFHYLWSMSSSSADVGAGTSLRSADHIHFYTRFYHSLKGWCYLPAGIILAVATLTTAVIRPAWLDTGWLPLSLLGGSALLTAPWAYYMHRRYRAAYGHVTQDQSPTSPLGAGSISLPTWMVYMMGILSWMARRRRSDPLLHNARGGRRGHRALQPSPPRRRFRPDGRCGGGSR